MSKKVIILGAGGHAKVIADIVVKNNDTLLGFLDDNKVGTTIFDFHVFGRIDEIEKYKENTEFVVGIGNNYIRKNIAERYNVAWYTAIHPSAQIGIDVKVGEGTVVMANAVINSSANVGKHCIVNTGAIIEHDNNIADYVHISPNAMLCGTVTIGKYTHIGAGVTIKNNVIICSDAVIGVGAVVVKDVKKKGIYIGIPAKMLKK